MVKYEKGQVITYSNPWQNKENNKNGSPDKFTRKVTDVYRGFALCGEGSDKTSWSGSPDVVFNDVCITMVGGFDYAKQYIDEILDIENCNYVFDCVSTFQKPLIDSGLASGSIINRGQPSIEQVKYEGRKMDVIKTILESEG